MRVEMGSCNSDSQVSGCMSARANSTVNAHCPHAKAFPELHEHLSLLVVVSKRRSPCLLFV